MALSQHGSFIRDQNGHHIPPHVDRAAGANLYRLAVVNSSKRVAGSELYGWVAVHVADGPRTHSSPA